MPTLGELKRAVQQALTWLWEWYWTYLETAFSLPSTDSTDSALTLDATSDKLQNILRTYIKARKQEIKTRRSPALCTAANHALSTYTLRFSASATTLPPSGTQNALLRCLVGEKMILPMDKKLGSSMSGAFLIWSPLLLAFCDKSASFLPSLLQVVVQTMNSADGEVSGAEKEGMCAWAAHVLTSMEWQGARGSKGRALREKLLGECLSELGVWNLRLAEMVVDGMGSEGEMWRMIVEAAQSEGGDSIMVVDETETVEEKEEAENIQVENIVESRPVEVVRTVSVKGKIKGPQKIVGLWKPKPIGWLPDGWDEDA
jgi:ribosomal biogenesis protein LAS1